MRLQDCILRGLAANRPAAGDVAPGTLYYSTDTETTERCADTGLTWETYTDAGGGGGTPALHAPTHASAGTDPVTLSQSQITGLVGALANKATISHAATHSNASSDPVTITNLAGFPGGTVNYLRADGTFNTPGGGVPAAHATTHEAGGSDQIKLDNLAAPDDNTDLNASISAHGLLKKLSNVSSEFLNGVGSFAVPAGVGLTGGFSVTIDGGGAVITTGVKFDLEMPFAGTITAVRLGADQTGSIVIDIWKDTYANYPPTVADTITASAKPTLSAALKSEDTTLTGWTVSFAAGNWLRFNVDSVATVTRVAIAIRYSRT